MIEGITKLMNQITKIETWIPNKSLQCELKTIIPVVALTGSSNRPIVGAIVTKR